MQGGRKEEGGQGRREKVEREEWTAYGGMKDAGTEAGR